MNIEENKAVVRRMYESFNQFVSTGEFGPVSEVMARNMVDHNPNPGQAAGIDGVKEVFGIYRMAFPDLHFSVEDQVAEGEKVATRLSVRATHQGDFQGIPPTGKAATITGIEILRVAGGQVVERWGEFDFLGLMTQLGVVPPPQG